MKKKKVAMVLSVEPQNGGEYQYALLLAECLHELSGKKFEIIAICTNRCWYRWCRQNHISFIKCSWPRCTTKQLKWDVKLPIYSKIYNAYRTELGKVIKKKNIDVLVLTEQFKYVPNLNVKVIVPVHDLMHRYEPDFPEVKSCYWVRELRLKGQAKYADCILTDSILGKRQFQESYLKALKKKPCVVSLPYIVPEHISKTREEYVKVPDKYIFYPAQFWKHKNHINLLKAIQIVRESIEDIQLVLVGSEKNGYEEVKKYISENDLGSHVTILGFVSNENITYLYKHAAGMVMPSYFGPTNIPPLEAMALGCPVAVSNRYAMPEQVGEAGLLFNPNSPEEIADCIKKLWIDENMRDEMIAKGYRRVNKWTKEKFKNRLLKVIERCV